MRVKRIDVWIGVYPFSFAKERNMLEECIKNVREQQPLIHNITNYVTVNDVANAILAVGASPIMADDAAEVEEITSLCQGLNINIGTLNSRTIESMKLAGKKAAALGHPLLLDPVGAGASHLRTNTAGELLDQIHFTAIRGNVSELKALAGQAQTTQGVDANAADAVTKDNLAEMAAFAKEYAKKTQSVIVMTGAIDLVADQDRCYAIYNGRAEMARITGTGCQLTGIMTAFLAANPDKPLEACACAVIAMGLAGEIAYGHLAPYEGNSSYRNRIIDALSQMDENTIKEGARYEIC